MVHMGTSSHSDRMSLSLVNVNAEMIKIPTVGKDVLSDNTVTDCAEYIFPVDNASGFLLFHAMS